MRVLFLGVPSLGVLLLGMSLLGVSLLVLGSSCPSCPSYPVLRGADLQASGWCPIAVSILFIGVIVEFLSMKQAHVALSRTPAWVFPGEHDGSAPPSPPELGDVLTTLCVPSCEDIRGDFV